MADYAFCIVCLKGYKMKIIEEIIPMFMIFSSSFLAYMGTNQNYTLGSAVFLGLSAIYLAIPKCK